MNVVKLDNENAKGVAALMHRMKPEWWPTFEEAYGQLTNIDESIGTIGWFLEDENGTPIGWTLFRELKCYLSLELECSCFNDNGVFKLEHKLQDLFDKATEYARSKGYTTLRTGMSSMDFNIDGKELVDIPTAISFLETMLMYGKEASNRKQEIDRQHYTIPNQRPKDKHCGKI